MIKKVLSSFILIQISSGLAFANSIHEEWTYTYHVNGDSGMSCDQTPAEAVAAAHADQDAQCAALNAKPGHEDCKIEGSDDNPPNPQRGDTDQDSELSLEWGENGPYICRAYGATVGPGICKCKVLVKGADDPGQL